MEYLIGLLEMLDMLKANDSIEVTRDKILSGHPEEYMKQDMQDLLEDLPFMRDFDFTDLISFYSECGGCDISWKQKNTKNPEQGAIKILSFENVFMQVQDYFDATLGSTIGTEFRGKTYKNKTFGEKLFLFDVYSDASGFALAFDEGPKPKVMMLSDYYIVWDHSKVTDFNSYFRFLLASRGSFSSRFECFSHYQGDRFDPIVYDQIPYNTVVEPALFRIK